MAKIASKPKQKQRSNQRSYNFANGGSMTADWGSLGVPQVGFMDSSRTAGAGRKTPLNVSGEQRLGLGGREEGLGRTTVQFTTGGIKDPRIKAGVENMRAATQADLDENDMSRRFRAAENAKERMLRQDELNKNYDVNTERNRIDRLQVNNENNYRMGSLGVERYKADQDFAVNNRQLDQERELTLADMSMKQSQFREGLSAERQEKAADRAAEYTDREQQLEGLRYQQDEETKRTKIQAQTSRYGADLDYASRIASNFSNTFQQGNQGWGQMIASFLSR